jgi:hypothetical protein
MHPSGGNSMSINVFLSVGRTSTAVQEQFVTALEEHLIANDLSHQTVGRTVYTIKPPLQSITECMRDCNGAIILAFERIYVQNGFEKRGGEEESVLTAAKISTVWNQIEAAIAYMLGLPLLVLVEHGVKQEGLLEKGNEWYVQPITLASTTFSKREFKGIFADWKKHVEEHQNNSAHRRAPPDEPIADGGHAQMAELSEEVAEEISHSRELIKQHQKRLRVLELQVARSGIQASPDIQIEVTDINEAIKTLRHKVISLESQKR